jgi:Leu/Phe-tRNA-protein transferase
MPRSFATISGLLKRNNASKVAFTTLCGFDEPCDFERTL